MEFEKPGFGGDIVERQAMHTTWGYHPWFWPFLAMVWAHFEGFVRAAIGCIFAHVL